MRDDDRKLRDHILKEIQRVTIANDGKVPGIQVFERETGIKQSAWSGKIWSRWGDALTEAGCVPNILQIRKTDEEIFKKLVEAFRYFGHSPAVTELRIYSRNIDPEFPSHSTYGNRYGSKALLLEAFSEWLESNAGHDDVLALIPQSKTASKSRVTSKKKTDGSVYLIRSGPHFKIGRSDEIERRIKEIRIALPEAAILEHTIVTDDPTGIEAYWHNRFKDRRANGEWFKLTPQDVLIFKRRKLQ
jgi:hypothetical protein